MTVFKYLTLTLAFAALTSCASWLPHGSVKQAASVVDYLYPNAAEAPVLTTPAVVTLRPPVRVGIAFVPGGSWRGALAETEKLKLLERVKSSFTQHSYIGGIEIIPTEYLRPKGGFTNLDQVAHMFNVDVMVLLSYDQVQFNDSNALAVLYWTLIGAYVIHGDQYDVQTLLDASVFDVRTRKLLFRAPGTSQVKGSASLAGFSEKSREAQSTGYQQALDQLVPRLQSELDAFKQRVKTDAGFKVENRAGYKGGGALDGLILLLAAVLAALGLWRRRVA